MYISGERACLESMSIAADSEHFYCRRLLATRAQVPDDAHTHRAPHIENAHLAFSRTTAASRHAVLRSDEPATSAFGACAHALRLAGAQPWRAARHPGCGFATHARGHTARRVVDDLADSDVASIDSTRTPDSVAYANNYK